MNTYTNPCIRCGKERLLVKTWTEKIKSISGKTIEVTRGKTICPDPECQKEVDKELRKQKAKRDKIKRDREDRAIESAKNKKIAKDKKIKSLTKKKK